MVFSEANYIDTPASYYIFQSIEYVSFDWQRYISLEQIVSFLSPAYIMSLQLPYDLTRSEA